MMKNWEPAESGAIALAMDLSLIHIYYGTVNAFQDLEAYLPPEIYSLAEDSIYSTEDEQGILKPVALSLEGTSFAGQTGIVMNPPYLAVMSTSQHKEEVLQMIEYLFR